jgi:hypothetical protein
MVSILNKTSPKAHSKWLMRDFFCENGFCRCLSAYAEPIHSHMRLQDKNVVWAVESSVFSVSESLKWR